MKCKECKYCYADEDGYLTCHLEDSCVNDLEEEQIVEDKYTYGDLGLNWW